MLEAGSLFGRYQIISSLGFGGMGEVYLAADDKLARKVAIKILSEKIGDDDDRLHRFRREAIAASALNHPNILTVYDVGEVDGSHYIASEFVDGHTIRHLLSGRRKNIRDILSILTQVADALTCAHAAGIVHRDIKPENIMERRDGWVKVLDFGLAKVFSGQRFIADSSAKTLSKHDTARGMMIGTAAYMSPEQARGGKVDERSDVWSLGVVLFELLTRQLPFEGETTSDMLASVLRSEPSPLTLLLPACPPELERIVTKCLQKDADERYQVMKDLALDLKALTRTLDRDSHSEQVSEVGAPMPSKRSLASFTSLATTKRLSPLHVIAILIAAIVVGGAAWWAFVRPEASAEAPPPALLKANEIISWSSIPGETDVFGSLSPPDGRMTVFESTRGGKLSIWVKQTSSGEPVEVTKDTFDNYNPVWSPKGDEIAYLSRRGSELGIWRIPALGGNPILIRKVDDGGSLLKRWLMNGSIYLESNSTLWSVDSNSGGIAQVVSTSPSMTWGSMNISQDGRQSSYVTEENGVSTLWAASATAAGRQVLSTASDMRNTVWDPDGQRILYSANIDGVYQLFAADVSGTKPTQLTFGETNCFPIDVSEDGTRILYGASKEDVQLWSVTTTDLREAPVVTDALADLWPDISPDGAELVYQAIPNISQADKIFDGAILLKSQAGESSNRRLADSGFLPVWSPDQSRVAFLRRGRGDDAALWLVAPSGGPPNRLTGEAIPLPELTVIPYNRYQSASFSWSPDSGTLAYITENANVRNINLVTAKDGSARQLTNNSSAESLPYSPLWSANGRSIAYSISPNSIPEGAEPRYALAVIDTSTGEDRVVAEMNHYVKLLGWANNDRELLFAAANKRRGVATPTQVLLGAVSVATGQTRQIAVLADAYLYDVHPSKDGRTIAFTAHRNGKDDVFIVPAAGGSERRLTDNKDPRVYLSNILWSPDGRTIYFGKQLTRFLLSLISNFK